MQQNISRKWLHRYNKLAQRLLVLKDVILGQHHKSDTVHGQKLVTHCSATGNPKNCQCQHATRNPQYTLENVRPLYANVYIFTHIWTYDGLLIIIYHIISLHFCGSVDNDSSFSEKFCYNLSREVCPSISDTPRIPGQNRQH